MSLAPGPPDPPLGTTSRRELFSRSLRALKNRNFRVFFVGEVISTVGSWMQMLAQGWLVLELTGSGRALGVTLALQTLPILVIGAWGGVLADRVDNRRLLVVPALLGKAQAIALGVMEATDNVTIHGFIWCPCSASYGLDRPAMQAMNYELQGRTIAERGRHRARSTRGRLLVRAGILIGTVGMAPARF
jgi:MFS family permease